MPNGAITENQALAHAAPFAPPRPSRRRVLARVALTCWIVASVAIGLWWQLETTRVTTIAHGRVYQSGALSDGNLRKVVREMGIRTVIDLRQPWTEVRHESAVLSALDVEHIHIPSEQVPDDSTVSRFLEVMSHPATYPVLIHCHHGTGRSVLFGAIYRVEFEGWDREQARLATRNSLRWLFAGSSFDPGAPKGSYLLHYVPRRRVPDRGAPDAAPTGSQG